jgi:hypothetical protein
VGVIVGLLFGPLEHAIVRWVGETAFEAMEDSPMSGSPPRSFVNRADLRDVIQRKLLDGVLPIDPPRRS